MICFPYRTGSGLVLDGARTTARAWVANCSATKAAVPSDIVAVTTLF